VPRKFPILAQSLVKVSMFLRADAFAELHDLKSEPRSVFSNQAAGRTSVTRSKQRNERLPVKSRFLHVHPLVNGEKFAELDALQECYTAYLQTCVAEMLAAHRFSVPRSERSRPAP